VASDTEGGKELYDFLQRLEAVSKFAITRADTFARFLSEQRNSTKLNFLANIHREISNLQPDAPTFLTIVSATNLYVAMNLLITTNKLPTSRYRHHYHCRAV
jgi:hypothetical protein